MDPDSHLGPLSQGDSVTSPGGPPVPREDGAAARPTVRLPRIGGTGIPHRRLRPLLTPLSYPVRVPPTDDLRKTLTRSRKTQAIFL